MPFTSTFASLPNVHVPTAPPQFFWPNGTLGAAVPSGGLNWELVVTSSKFPTGSSCDLTVQYQYSGGVWQDDVGAGGFTLGPYLLKGVLTSTNGIGSSIGVGASPYPTHARLRVDACPAGTLDLLSVTVFR